MQAAFLRAPALVRKIVLGAPRIAVDAMVHQGMRGVQHSLDFGDAVGVLAARDEVTGEGEIVQDAVGVRPLPEQVVILEEVIVSEGGMGDHQRLHRHGVLLHDVADAGARVDDDLIGETLQAVPIERFLAGKSLAEAPMPVHQR